MIEKMAELVRDKRIEGISDIRDESDRQGYRVVIELKRDADRRRDPQPALPLHAAADLFRRQCGGAERRQAGSADADRHAEGLHLLPRGGRSAAAPNILLRKARDRAHVLVGLAIAVANIDEVIKLIRSAPDPQTAREQLMDAALAGGGCRGADPADRRSAPPDQRRRHLQSLRGAGARHSRAAACSA